jgi:hypothetical protein
MQIDLGSSKQVFVDWSLINPGYGLPCRTPASVPKHKPYGVRIAVHSPTVLPDPIVRPEYPWEEVLINCYCTLLQDEAGLKLYYEAYGPHDGGRFKGNNTRLCLAESADGVRWQRKMVNLVNVAGTIENNVVYSPEFPGSMLGHGCTVFRDPSAPPAERYKLVHGKMVPPGPRDWRTMPVVFGAVSPDGIRWTPLEEPLLQHPSDTQVVVQYDSTARVYRGLFRGFSGDYNHMHPLAKDYAGVPIHGRRGVDQAATSDFRNWPKPEPALYPEPDDPPDWDIYTNAYAQWPGANMHLMFPAFYYRASDLVEVHLATSRDGRNWKRIQRGPISPAGAQGTSSEGGIYAGQGIAVLTDRWLLPVTPQTHTHNWVLHQKSAPKAEGGVWLAAIRPDGFTSLSADEQGECWTFPFTFTGKNLALNSWAGTGGHIRVGLEDQNGPIADYAVEDCTPLEGDCLWKSVRWRGGDLSRFAGKEIVLHVQLKGARLHAFRFTND